MSKTKFVHFVLAMKTFGMNMAVKKRTFRDVINLFELRKAILELNSMKGRYNINASKSHKARNKIVTTV